jgi:hypothetical protein
MPTTPAFACSSTYFRRQVRFLAKSTLLTRVYSLPVGRDILSLTFRSYVQKQAHVVDGSSERRRHHTRMQKSSHGRHQTRREEFRSSPA